MADLKAELSSRGLSTTGRKGALRTRLEAALDDDEAPEPAKPAAAPAAPAARDSADDLSSLKDKLSELEKQIDQLSRK